MRFNTMKGAAVGALLAYLLDPALGRRRRAILSHRALNFSRAMIAARRDRQLPLAADKAPEIAASAADTTLGFLRRRRARASRPQGWENPMTTVHIDVDDRYAMPGLETVTTRSMRAPHRGFTRTSRGVYWKVGEAGALPPK